MKMESIQQRREELERKEYTLKESLLKFDKFLKENDAKKNRAVKKANAERDAKLQRMQEIGALSAEASMIPFLRLSDIIFSLDTIYMFI